MKSQLKAYGRKDLDGTHKAIVETDLSEFESLLNAVHNTPRFSADFNLDLIAERTVGFVGADIAALCSEAAYNALRRSFPPDAFEKGQVIPRGRVV